MHPALQALCVIVIGVGGCIAYFYFSNLFLDKVLFPARGPNAGRNINRANMIRPWLFLFPALVALGLYLAYPVFATAWLSLPGQGGAVCRRSHNYRRCSASRSSGNRMRNNMLWLIVVPAASTAFGLLAAQLTDRIRWGNIAKSLIFMPMAISFVGASVIWKLIYDARDCRRGADRPAERRLAEVRRRHRVVPVPASCCRLSCWSSPLSAGGGAGSALMLAQPMAQSRQGPAAGCWPRHRLCAAGGAVSSTCGCGRQPVRRW